MEGTVLVLTHECDADPANDRAFNDDVLICPVITLEALVEQMNEDQLPDPEQRNFLTSLGTRRIHRLVYLPPCRYFVNGGVIYLNRITNTHVSQFSPPTGTNCCALSAYGLRDIEYAIENHFRPKTERLAFQY